MVFLIQYDRRAGRILVKRTFEDADRVEAERARLDLELSNQSADTDQEIVLLEADSEDELRKTHRRYFESVREILESAQRELASEGPV